MKPTKVILLAGAAVLAFPGAAAASDIEMAPPSVPMTDSALSHWDGLYVGGHVGYSLGVVSGTFLGFSSIDLPGFSAGGQVGYNVTLGSNIVVGLEGDLDWTDQAGSHAESAPYVDADHVNWTGALTGRIGASFDNVMPYFLAGAAFANNTISYSATIPPANNATDTENHVGWVIGAGLAAKLTDNLSVYAEYRYANYGSREYPGVQYPAENLAESSVRSGINFHFN